MGPASYSLKVDPPSIHHESPLQANRWGHPGEDISRAHEDFTGPSQILETFVHRAAGAIFVHGAP